MCKTNKSSKGPHKAVLMDRTQSGHVSINDQIMSRENSKYSESEAFLHFDCMLGNLVYICICLIHIIPSGGIAMANGFHDLGKALWSLRSFWFLSSKFFAALLVHFSKVFVLEPTHRSSALFSRQFPGMDVYDVWLKREGNNCLT